MTQVKFLARLALFVLVIGLLAVALSMVYEQVSGIGGQVQVDRPEININTGSDGRGSDGLNPVEKFLLETQLNAQRGKLRQRPSDDSSTVSFEVHDGESAAAIGERLEKLGLVVDGALFRTYLRVNGLDAGLEAGKFTLRRNMTIPEVAETLSHAYAEEAVFTIPEGWRYDQIADALDDKPELNITGEQFRAALEKFSAEGAARFDFLADRPAGATLEGYLFPDSYRVPEDATAEWLVEKMLATFGARVTPELREKFQERELTVYEAITVASIVEREARVAAERPTIASVYLNRLEIGMKLDADPTIQYALGWDAEQKTYWRPLLLDDLQLDSPYNTYLNAGLPPSPIANPGLSSIQAVAYPAETNYLFFRAKCDGSGEHNFAETLEQQAANACE